MMLLLCDVSLGEWFLTIQRTIVYPSLGSSSPSRTTCCSAWTASPWRWWCHHPSKCHEWLTNLHGV